MIIDFRKCAVFEHYQLNTYVMPAYRTPDYKPEWKLVEFDMLYPHNGDWLVMRRRADQIDWNDPVFIADDIDTFLDPEFDLIRFLPAEQAKQMVNLWVEAAKNAGQTYYMQSSFNRAKRLATSEEISKRN